MNAKYKLKEKGVVQQIVTLAASVIIVGVLVMIGLNLMAATNNVTYPALKVLADKNAELYSGDVNIGTAGIKSVQNSFSLVSTTTGYFTILYLAVIGGLAIAAILGYLAFSSMRQGGSSSGGAM